MMSMAGALKRGRPQGLMSLLGQGEEPIWWRPLIVPFRPLVIIFNLILGSRAQFAGASGRPPQLAYTNEQVYEITWDEIGRPVKVTVHRAVHET